MRSIRYALPFNWMSINLAADLEAQIAEAASRLTANTQNDDVDHRAQSRVRDQLLEQVSALRDAGAQALILEADPVVDVRTGITMTISPMEIPSGTDPMDWLVAIAARTPGARVLETEQAVILRTDSASQVGEEMAVAVEAQEAFLGRSLPIDVDRARSEGITRHRITYYLGDPNAPDDWKIIMAMLNVGPMPEQRDLASAVLTVCDDVVASVRWE